MKPNLPIHFSARYKWINFLALRDCGGCHQNQKLEALSYPASSLSLRVEVLVWISVMYSDQCWKLCLGGGGSTQFSGMIIFSMELYYGDQLCSKCMTISFVSFLVNKIWAYKYNILMTLQSTIASAVTVIAGILVCIAIRLPIGLPPAPWSCVLYFCICEYFEKLTKLVT